MRTAFAVLLFVAQAVALPAYAAHIYLDPPEGDINQRDTFYVPVRIELDDECINAVRVSIAYNPEEVTIQNVGIGKSILTLWTEPPEIMRVDTKETGTVTFEGGIPGGYCGRVIGDPGLTNILAELVVSGSPLDSKEGDAHIARLTVLPDTAVYAHDGLGTRLDRTLQGAELNLVRSDEQPYNAWLADISSDTQAPEYFDVTLIEGPSAGNERHYIIFSTTDKQSGVDHYEVREMDPNQFGFLSWIGKPSYWILAESPYVLRDQRLHSTIQVKAVDKQGNERIVEYTPPMSPLVRYTSPAVLVLLVSVALLLAGVGVLFAFVRRLKRGRRLTDEHGTGNDSE